MKAKVDSARAADPDPGSGKSNAQVGLSAGDTVPDLASPTESSSPPDGFRPLAQHIDLGEYVLQEEIGRGGMGVVYKARQKHLDRMVAVKMIVTGQMASPQMRDLFLAEARAAARVRHPNIVGVYEVGEAHGWHFIAMELVDGRSLDQLIAEQPLSPMDAARTCRHVARAVSHLHAKGIVHRDLKPSNILIDAEGRPYVTDFGLAKVYETESGQTLTGLLAGTPSYMSPEQAAGRHRDVGFKSDVYSAGAVLYHALTGQPPFAGDNPQQTLAQVLHREPLSPRRLCPEIPIPLDCVCMKCLEKDPDRRYPSGKELAEDLARFVEGEPVEARPPGPWRKLVRWARREPALAVRLVAMAAFYLIELVWFHIFGWSGLEFHVAATVVVPLWAVGSILCQRRLRRSRRPWPARAAWACLDILFATALLLFNEKGVSSPLIMLYPLLVAGSGLWCSARLVWVCTGAAMVSYSYLWYEALRFRPLTAGESRYHIVFLTALAILGLIVALQTRRMRPASYAACDGE